MGSTANRELRRGPAGDVRADTDTAVVRNRPGPASDAVRSAALKQRLAEREPKPAPTPPPPAAENPTKDLSVMTAADRLKHRGLQVDTAVDKAAQ